MTIDVRRKLYKWVCYVALLLIVAVLQTTILSSFRVLSCAPSMIPFIVAVISLREGVGEGMLAGLVGGFICDAIYSDHEGFYTLTLTFLALLICVMNLIMYWKSYGMAIIDWAVLMVLMHLIHYAIYMLLPGTDGAQSLLYVIPGELLATAPFTPFVYAILKETSRHFEEIEDI